MATKKLGWAKLPAAWALRPHKAGILANVDVCEAVGFPKFPSIAKRSARKPWLQVRRVDVLPGAMLLDIEKKVGDSDTDLSVLSEQGLNLIVESVRSVPVVIIQ